MEKIPYAKMDPSLSLEEEIICCYLRGGSPIPITKEVPNVQPKDLITLPGSSYVYKVINTFDSTKGIIVKLQNMEYPKEVTEITFSKGSPIQKVIKLRNLIGRGSII